MFEELDVWCQSAISGVTILQSSVVVMFSKCYTRNVAVSFVVAFQQVCVPLHILCCFISVYSPFEQVNKIKGLVSRV